MKRSALIAVILVIGIGCVILGGVAVSRLTPARQPVDEVAMLRLQTMATEAEAAKAEAKALPEAIERQGEADVGRTVAHTDAYVRRTAADAQIYLALHVAKLVDQWSTFIQMTLFVAALFLAGAVGLSWRHPEEVSHILRSFGRGGKRRDLCWFRRDSAGPSAGRGDKTTAGKAEETDCR